MITEARRRVRAPSFVLKLVAGIGLIYSVLGVALSYVGAPIAKEMYLFLQDIGLELSGMFDVSELEFSSDAFLWAGVNVALWSFVLFAAGRMRKLRNRGLCLFAAVLAMVPTQCCCGIGMIVGFWCLSTLGDDEVRSAFDRPAPRPVPDSVRNEILELIRKKQSAQSKPKTRRAKR